MFCRAAGTLIFHGKIHNFYFISIIRVQQFFIIVDIFYITFIDIFHKSIKVLGLNGTLTQVWSFSASQVIIMSTISIKNIRKI